MKILIIMYIIQTILLLAFIATDIWQRVWFKKLVQSYIDRRNALLMLNMTFIVEPYDTKLKRNIEIEILGEVIDGLTGKKAV